MLATADPRLAALSNESGLMSCARATFRLSVVLVLLTYGFALAQDSPHIGLKVRTLTADLRKQRKLPDDAQGALVTAVTPGSPAKEKGIAPGEVIVEAGGKAVADAKEVASQIAVASASGSIMLRVMDAKGGRREVSVPIEKRPAQSSKSLLPGPK